jgi:Leucine-rich repeat (LRR) protein
MSSNGETDEWNGGRQLKSIGKLDALVACAPGEVTIPRPESVWVDDVLHTVECKDPEEGGELNLRRAGLREVPDEISKLKNLERLRLDHNKISKIENLEGLESLKVLDLTSNEIFKIEGLEDLDNLEELGLQLNEIERIENLEGLGSLRVLDLAANKISEIEGLGSLDRLEHLDLTENRIDKVSADGSAETLKRLYEEGTVRLLLNPGRKEIKESLGLSLGKRIKSTVGGVKSFFHTHL